MESTEGTNAGKSTNVLVEDEADGEEECNCVGENESGTRIRIRIESEKRVRGIVTGRVGMRVCAS